MCLRHQEVSFIHFRPIVYVGHRPQAIAHPLWREQTYIFSSSARVQRWALTLAMYNYQIAFKPTTAHSNAGGLSRLPLSEAPSEVPVPPEFVLLIEHLLDAPVKAYEIRTWTWRDPLLSKVKQFIQSGWPATVESQLRPYWTRRFELTVLDGCILWESQVVIPSPGRQLCYNSSMRVTQVWQG